MLLIYLHNYNVNYGKKHHENKLSFFKIMVWSMLMRSDISKVATNVALKRNDKISKNKTKTFIKTNIKNTKGIIQ